MSQRITLADMAEAAQERADYHDASAMHFASEYPDPVRHAEHAKKAAVFNASAQVFRQLAIDPDKSRKHITGLIEEYQHG